MPHRQSEWQKLVSRFFEAGILEWLSFFATILAFAVILWLVFRIRAWLSDDVDAAESEQELLIQMMEMHREGDLSEEEYRSIKHRLAVRLRSTSPAAMSNTVAESKQSTSQHGQ